LECIRPELRSGWLMQPKRSLGLSRWTPEAFEGAAKSKDYPDALPPNWTGHADNTR